MLARHPQHRFNPASRRILEVRLRQVDTGNSNNHTGDHHPHLPGIRKAVTQARVHNTVKALSPNTSSPTDSHPNTSSNMGSRARNQDNKAATATFVCSFFARECQYWA